MEPRPRAPPAGASVAGPSSKKKRSGRKHRKKRGAAGNLGVGSPADTVRAEPPESHVKVSEMRHEDKVIMAKDTLEDALDAEVTADNHSESQLVVPSAGGVVGTIFYNHNKFFRTCSRSCSLLLYYWCRVIILAYYSTATTTSTTTIIINIIIIEHEKLVSASK